MKKHLLTIGLACGLLVSCQQQVVYEAPDFEEKQPKEIKVLNDEYLFRYGSNLMVADSLLIVSTGNSENHIAAFNRYTGDLVKEFGRKGPGPNELAMPAALSVDGLNRLLYVCDLGKRSLLRYDLHELQKEGTPEYTSVRLADDFARTSMLCFLKDSLFYAPAPKEGRMLVGVPSEVQDSITSETPDISKFPTQADWYNYMNLQSVTAVRPDGKYLAAGSAMGGILEVFDLDKKKRTVLKHFYEPIFKQKGLVFQPVPETIGGFMCLSATDKYLYATLHGKANPTSMPTAICKFDWKGRPIARYDCGQYAIFSFAVDEEEQIAYAVAIGKEGEQLLLKISLP